MPSRVDHLGDPASHTKSGDRLDGICIVTSYRGRLNVYRFTELFVIYSWNFEPFLHVHSSLGSFLILVSSLGIVFVVRLTQHEETYAESPSRRKRCYPISNEKISWVL